MRNVKGIDFWTNVASHHDKEEVELISRDVKGIHNLRDPDTMEKPEDRQVLIEETGEYIKSQFMPAIQKALMINGCSCPEYASRRYAIMICVAEIIILTDSDNNLDEKLLDHEASYASQRQCFLTEEGDLVCYCDEHSH